MRPAPIEIELGYRTYWLVRLRWVFSSAIIWGTFIGASVAGLGLDAIPLYLTGAVVAIYNSLFLIALKLNEVEPPERAARGARLLAHGQVVADLVTLGLLLHFSGGAENPIGFYFVFHVIVASILLSRAEAFLQATLAVALYGGLISLEFAGILPHVHLLGSQSADLAHDPRFVSVAFLVFASTVYSTSYLATSIVSRLRDRDTENRMLASEIESKSAELQMVWQSLVELEEAKGQQLSRMYDEVRSRLTLLRGWLDSLASGIAGDLSPGQRDLVDMSARRADEMLELMSNLRAMSRTDSKTPADCAPVDLYALARDVVAGCGAAATDRGVAVSLEGRAGEAVVRGDVESLKQLLSHLLSNAMSYTLSGGTVRVSIECSGETVRVQVADTGIGVPSADLSRVFDQFFRSENARRYRPEGGGLGLSVARTVVERHGGQMEMDSRLGVGTTVTVLLPRAPESLPERSDVDRAYPARTPT